MELFILREERRSRRFSFLRVKKPLVICRSTYYCVQGDKTQTPFYIPTLFAK